MSLNLDKNLLNKYSNKIIKYFEKIKMESFDIKYSNELERLVTVMKNIIGMKTEEFESIHENSILLKKLHDSDQFPLQYIMFKKLYNMKALKKLFKFAPDINDFWEFMKWYNYSQHLIDYEQIKKTIKKLNDTELNEIYEILFNVKNKRRDLHDLLYENSFVSIDIQQNAESSDMYLYEYSNSFLDIKIYYFIEEQEKIKNLLRHIIRVVQIIKKIYNKNNKANIIIFCSKQKKYLSRSEFIMPVNTNSGSSIDSIYVRVWRFEEILKVLFHELVHYYKIDTDSFSNEANLLNKKIINEFKIDGYDRCNEAFTELIAVTLHSIYLSCILNIDVKKLLEYELLFSLFQTKKILKHFKKTEPEFNDIKNRLINPKQTTSVFSYYVIKTLLLLNHEIFVLSFKENGSEKNNEFSLFVSKILNKDDISLDHKINNLWKQFNNADSDFINKTMRMTLFELNYSLTH